MHFGTNNRQAIENSQTSVSIKEAIFLSNKLYTLFDGSNFSSFK